MSQVTPSTGRSVLDEVRSTIASLDALRVKAGRESSGPNPPVREQVPSGSEAAPPASSVAAPAERLTEKPEPQSAGLASARPTELADAGLSRVDDVGAADGEIDHVAAEAGNGADDRGGPESVILRHVNKDACIMIVDDEPLNIMTFRQHLIGDGYHNFLTTDKPRQALVMLREQQPDVLLLDIHMPEVSGLDIVRIMSLDPVLQHIPVLILTAATDPRVRRQALDMGASDFLNKPVDPDELLPRVRNAIILKQHYDMVSNEAARLEQQVERRTRQLEATRQQLILSLARAAEHRDNDTGNHVIRVGRYAALIASALGYPSGKLSMLEQAAQLHDVGKIGIPDSILFKPGKLDQDQYELMKRHCALGKQIIEPIAEKDWEVLKTHTRRGENLLHVRSSPLLMLAARIAQTHHEKFDGSGYPLGLAGQDIPLEGRIVAVADVFDALSSARPYKKPFSREKCFEILEEGRGTHFDPQVLDAFFRKSDDIIETQLMLMDEEGSFVGPDYV